MQTPCQNNRDNISAIPFLTVEWDSTFCASWKPPVFFTFFGVGSFGVSSSESVQNSMLICYCFLIKYSTKLQIGGLLALLLFLLTGEVSFGVQIFLGIGILLLFPIPCVTWCRSFSFFFFLPIFKNLTRVFSWPDSKRALASVSTHCTVLTSQRKLSLQKNN